MKKEHGLKIKHGLKSGGAPYENSKGDDMLGNEIKYTPHVASKQIKLNHESSYDLGRVMIKIVAKALDGQRYPLPLCEYM